MNATQILIEGYAERIEQAYNLRRPNCRRSLICSGVWAAAAEILRSVHETELSTPPDPELFVASQPHSKRLADPWSELAGPDSGRRYRDQVNTIIRGLSRELRREVRFAEARIVAGEDPTTVLTSKSRRLSPLGRFIVAHRAGLDALARRFHRVVLRQHQSCPLYRQASEAFLPAELYPVSQSAGAVAIRRTQPRIQSN